jgi:hypothetical protein
MGTIIHIARHLVRKIVKPVVLWWTDRALKEAEDQADFYMHLRRSIVPMERKQRERQVQLIGRRNEVRGW